MPRPLADESLRRDTRLGVFVNEAELSLIMQQITLRDSISAFLRAAITRQLSQPRLEAHYVDFTPTFEEGRRCTILR